MDLSDFSLFLTTRSSVRQFSDEPVTEEEVDHLLACASLAPSAGNLESWDVVVVRDEGIREDLAEAAFGQEHIFAAPVVLAVCANYVRSMAQYGERGILYGLEDAVIAGTYLMLAAHAADLQTCWTGAFDDDDVRELLDLPGHIRPVALIALGRGSIPSEMMPRMPVAEHVHRDTW